MKRVTLVNFCFGLVMVATLMVSGCTTTQKYAGGGAVAGSALGAGIAHNDRGSGALVGAAVGALAGTVLGQHQELKDSRAPVQKVVVCPSCNSRVDVSGFPKHATVACPNCKSHFTF